MKDGKFTAKEKTKWRGRGLHVGYCWKCGKEFVYARRIKHRGNVGPFVLLVGREWSCKGVLCPKF